MLAASPAIARDKPSLGVVEFKNETSAGWWGSGVGWELSGMLSNELASLKAFKVVERNKLESVMREQNLGASGRTSSGTGAKIGKLTGAKYLVMGTVTSYEENTAGTGGGLSFKGVSFGGKKSTAYIAVDIRVVNSTTGELDFVRSVEATSKSGGMRVGIYRGGFGGNLGSQKKTPAGKAIRAVIMEVADYLECAMVIQGSCMDDFDAKESRRREKTKGAVSLD